MSHRILHKNFSSGQRRKLHTNYITGHNTRTTSPSQPRKSKDPKEHQATKDLTMNEAEISVVENALTHLNINPSTGMTSATDDEALYLQRQRCTTAGNDRYTAIHDSSQSALSQRM